MRRRRSQARLQPASGPPGETALARLRGAASAVRRSWRRSGMAGDDIEGLLARCGLGDRAAFRALYAADRRETLRRGAAYPRQPQRCRGSRAGSLRQNLAQRRPLPGRPRQRAGLAGLDRPQPGDRPAARPPGADARHRRHGRTGRSGADAGGERARVPTTGGGSRPASAQLPRDRAQAVQAAYVEGWSYEDLARRFDVPLNTMRTWLQAGADQPAGVPGAMTRHARPAGSAGGPGHRAGRRVRPAPARAGGGRRLRRARGARPGLRGAGRRLARRLRGVRRGLCRGGAAGGAGAADRARLFGARAVGAGAALAERRALAGGGGGGGASRRLVCSAGRRARRRCPARRRRGWSRRSPRRRTATSPSWRSSSRRRRCSTSAGPRARRRRAGR